VMNYQMHYLSAHPGMYDKIIKDMIIKD
jgi:hypothetical protein